MKKNSKTEAWRAVKFTLFSISAGVIQLLVGDVIMMNLLGIDYWISYLTGLVLSVLWNFTLNRKITFKSANNVPVAMLKVAAFYLVFTPLSTVGGNCLTGIGWNPDLVFVLSMLLNFVLEYLYQRFFVFGKSIDTAVKPKEQDATEQAK